MQINIKTKNLKLTQAIEKYINEKIISLDKFFTEEDFKIKTFVEIEKTTLHHKKGDVFRAEGQMKLPGKDIRAEVTLGDLYVAINEMKDELQRGLKEYKDKMISKRKRGARIIKKEAHLSPEARFYRRGRIINEGM